LTYATDSAGFRYLFPLLVGWGATVLVLLARSGL